MKLIDFGRQYRLATITARIGPSMKECDFECCIFRMLRGGNKIFVSPASVYKALCLSQFGGQSSRWFYNGRARWSKVLWGRCSHRIGRNAEARYARYCASQTCHGVGRSPHPNS